MTECSIDLSIWSESLRTTAFPEGDASTVFNSLISGDGITITKSQLPESVRTFSVTLRELNLVIWMV